MAHRETTLTVFGTQHTIRTEQTGTVRQLEKAHTDRVKATLEALYAAGKPAALAAANRAATAAERRARGHHSGPALVEATLLRQRVSDIEKRRFVAPSGRSLAYLRRPFPKVRFDIPVTDPRVADYHQPITPEPVSPAPVGEEPAAPTDEAPAMSMAELLELFNPQAITS